MIHNKDALWVKVITAKYGTGKGSIPEVKKRSSESSTWKGIRVAWKFMVNAWRWNIGNGVDIKFWTDAWLHPGFYLKDVVVQPIPLDLYNVTVADMCDINGNWSFCKFTNLLPQEVILEIQGRMGPSTSLGRDTPIWALGQDGLFSVKTAYNLVNQPFRDHERCWNLVWKKNIPQRTKVFLWLLLKGGLPTKWGVSLQSSFFSMDLRSWIFSNLANSSSWKDRVTWDVCFAISTWILWLDRNENLFSNSNSSHSSISQRIHYFLESYLHVISSVDWIVTNRSYRHILVGWEFPSSQWIKCNLDATYQDDGNSVGCGGCFRDSTGKWILGFIRRLGRCSINMAELWAIYTAIIQGRNANMAKLWIESDSYIGVSLINRGCSDHHPCRQLVQLIRRLIIDHGQIKISHIFREANRCADALARMFVASPFGFQLIQEPPTHVFQLLCDDIMGASFFRRTLI
ncbi:Ribonuclease H-like superfamily [Sesbania bispinosa]|nr:Ribonuclease H-like superfamily [Sesbania bispinosa]